jgi:MYXO-CTERM domain-containing protein
MNNRRLVVGVSVLVIGCTTGRGDLPESSSVRQASFDPGACTPADATKAPFVNGSGSPGTPYGICTLAQLDQVRSNLSASYILLGDVDASATSSGSGLDFAPIGDCGADQSCGSGDDAPFTGSFDGNGHVIFGLHVSRPAQTGVGLFGRVAGTGVALKNVSLADANVTGNSLIGALVGHTDASVDHCAVSGVVSGSSTGDSTGGLVGRVGRIGGPLVTATISHSSSSAVVTGGDDSGGLVGDLQWGAQAVESFSSGSVSGRDQVGGLAGHLYEGTILDGYSSASVAGRNCVGGLNGTGDFTTLTNVYATGTVTGSMQVGGLSGCEGNTGLSNAFATGKVTGSSKVGALDGEKWGGTVTNTLFYVSAGIPAVMCGYVRPSEPGVGCNDQAFATGDISRWYSAQNAPMSAWGANTWTFSSTGYPVLTSATVPPASDGIVDAGPVVDASIPPLVDASIPPVVDASPGGATDASHASDASKAPETGAGGAPSSGGRPGAGGVTAAGGAVSTGGRAEAGGTSAGGASHSGGSATADAATSVDGGSSPSQGDSGCGCRTASKARQPAIANYWGALLAVLAFAVRRRAQRRDRIDAVQG